MLKRFVDLKDNDYVYCAGDKYPRKGAKVTQERIDELLSNKNRQGIPLISEEKQEG